ncbi:MAG: hypothetical protein AAFQ14_00315 [Cyanobacteria bacterium J06621_12]
MLISNLKFGSVLHKLKEIGLAIALLASLFGCQTPLIVVEEISAKKVDKTVYLTGKVVHQAPFLDNAAYQLEDETGKIWVVTTQNPPRLNQKINIKGKIQYQSLPFAQQELGDFYVVELEQLSSLSP